ncbi:fasciclin domain-containing protein [Chitinophaga pendula]|uniref:fasciclin domain-containing protein n=1 Tax=Chitinophaga TaxID=79328 RepID=UPI000BB013DB|nr:MULTISPECIES: fasciclin domain-containing protein [Chitinophaga]ASZ11283.1 fasciclin [Chitinophaga sp. MD30]UCJ05717.1 fasciclin domain-containing protein [Chitinophaga pendula]
MRFKYAYIAALILLPIAQGMSGCNKEDNIRLRDNNILPSVIKDNFNLKIFSTALDRSNLTPQVSKPGPFTLLVPADAAFIAAGYSNPGAVQTASQETIRRLTAYHILEGTYELDKLPFLFNQEINSYSGGKLFVTRWVKGKDTILTVNGSRILLSSVKASNGIMHIMNRVLNPNQFDILADALAGDRNLTLFYQAVRISGLEQMLTGQTLYTVFAPNNNAMTSYGYNTLEAIQTADPAALREFVKYHILSDRHFVNDYVLSAGPSATATATMLNNNAVKVTLIPNSTVPGGYEGITLTGIGNGNTPAKIFKQDVITNNGVLHTIDQVLKLSQ